MFFHPFEGDMVHILTTPGYFLICFYLSCWGIFIMPPLQTDEKTSPRLQNHYSFLWDKVQMVLDGMRCSGGIQNTSRCRESVCYFYFRGEAAFPKRSAADRSRKINARWKRLLGSGTKISFLESIFRFSMENIHLVRKMIKYVQLPTK